LVLSLGRPRYSAAVPCSSECPRPGVRPDFLGAEWVDLESTNFCPDTTHRLAGIDRPGSTRACSRRRLPRLGRCGLDVAYPPGKGKPTREGAFVCLTREVAGPYNSHSVSPVDTNRSNSSCGSSGGKGAAAGSGKRGTTTWFEISPTPVELQGVPEQAPCVVSVGWIVPHLVPQGGRYCGRG